jgi:hypothetical protein
MFVCQQIHETFDSIVPVRYAKWCVCFVAKVKVIKVWLLAGRNLINLLKVWNLAGYACQ